MLIDQMKCLVEKFNFDKDKDLEEACENSVLNEEVIPIEKPNCDDKRVQNHNDKFNKIIERNMKLLNQFVDMWQCADVNDLADKVEFGLSIMDNLESGSASEKCKVKSLCGKWTKKEEKIEKSTSDMDDVDNTIFIEYDKILFCTVVVVHDNTNKKSVPCFYRVLSVWKTI